MDIVVYIIAYERGVFFLMKYCVLKDQWCDD